MKGRVREILDAHAATVIKAVMADHRMGAIDFRVMKTGRHVRARADAMARLRADGFSIQHISEIMHLGKKAVEYHLSSTIRERRNAKRAERYARLEAEARSLALSAHPLETHSNGASLPA